MIVRIDIPTFDSSRAGYIGSLLQNAINVTNQADLVKLLEKVHKQPSIVKTAVNLI